MNVVVPEPREQPSAIGRNRQPPGPFGMPQLERASMGTFAGIVDRRTIAIEGDDRAAIAAGGHTDSRVLRERHPRHRRALSGGPIEQTKVGLVESNDAQPLLGRERNRMCVPERNGLLQQLDISTDRHRLADAREKLHPRREHRILARNRGMMLK
ncbi:hypothetical protein [Pendulispora albinea]|uniref:Uncharacterized protein n=1 Tax=Pendulispora albinea TaxID=2741071 RepID=A0ABZ2MA58_9BACT